MNRDFENSIGSNYNTIRMLRNNIPKEISMIINEMVKTEYIPLKISYTVDGSEEHHIFESCVESDYITYTCKDENGERKAKIKRGNIRPIIIHVIKKQYHSWGNPEYKVSFGDMFDTIFFTEDTTYEDFIKEIMDEYIDTFFEKLLKY